MGYSYQIDYVLTLRNPGIGESDIRRKKEGKIRDSKPKQDKYTRYSWVIP